MWSELGGVGNVSGGLPWSVNGLAPMDLVALYFGMVPFNLAALLHARTRTDDLGLVGKLSLQLIAGIEKPLSIETRVPFSQKYICD